MWNAISNNMSEFSFVCPACGQNIKCESWRSNSMMECPSCFQRVIVPQAPATDDVELIIKGSKAAKRVVTKPETNLGTPPVPTPPAKDSLVPGIAFVVLLCAALAMAFIFKGKIFKSTGNQTSGQTNQVVTTPRKQQTSAPPPTTTTNNANWTLKLDAVTIPSSAVTGYVHGKAFIPEQVTLAGGAFTLRTADNPPTVGVSIYLHANRSEDLARQSVNIEPDSAGVPWIDLRWKDEGGQYLAQTITKGYALRIEFGQLTGNRLPGKIYLCTPDGTKSWLKGAFDAQILNSR
jgi:DNA-directed RNA polymerase subunit RPC12/RpoP